MNKLVLGIFLVVAFAEVSAQENTINPSQRNKKWTLRECVNYAMEHNISIKQSALDLKAAKIDKSDAIGNYLPSLNGSASNSWNTGLTQNVTTGVLQQQTTRNLSLGLTAGITLFDGLRNLRELQRAKLTTLAGQYSLGKMKNDITLFVANSYLDVLVNKETLKVLQEQNKVTQKQYKRTQELVDAGSVPEGDLLEIEATNANEQQQIITAKNNVKISLISLAQTLLIKNYKTFDIVDQTYDVPLNDILNKDPQTIIERAKKERYEIKIAKEDVALAEKDVEIAKSQYYPSLSAFFNYNTRESGAKRFEQFQGDVDPDDPATQIGVVEATGESVVAPNYTSGINALNPRPFFEQLSRNDGFSYGVQLSIPFLNGFSTRNSVRRNKINVERSEYKLEQAELDLESNVYQAYVDAQGAAEAYQASKVAVKSQQKAYDYAQERYDVGIANAFDFSQSKFRLSDAKSKLVQAKFDYIFKLKVLELYFGLKPADIKM